MVADDLIVFDTCTLPEYYDDVHKILSLPPAISSLMTIRPAYRESSPDDTEPVRNFGRKGRGSFSLIIQARDYKKGDPSSNDSFWPEDSFVTLTRLAELVRDSHVGNDEAKRYYLDLSSPRISLDRHQTIAKDIAAKLHGRSCVP